MKPQLTHRQQQALDFITSCLDANGYPPTLREIGEHMGIRSTNGVNDHLKALERKGYLVREELKSRALRPVDAPETARMRPEIPILGRVAAGQPILADENVTNRISVDQFFLHGHQPREVFGLVLGDGLKIAGAGLALGLVGTYFVGEAMRSQLYEVAPSDPFVIGSVSLILTAVAVAATMIPARRAARVNPLTALGDQ